MYKSCQCLNLWTINHATENSSVKTHSQIYNMVAAKQRFLTALDTAYEIWRVESWRSTTIRRRRSGRDSRQTIRRRMNSTTDPWRVAQASGGSNYNNDKKPDERRATWTVNSDRQQAQGQGRQQLNDVTPAKRQCELRNTVN